MLKTATELVVESWNLYAKNWRKFLPFIIMMFLPTLILSVIGTISLYLEFYIPSTSMASNIIITIIKAASIVFAVWVTIALTKTIFDCLSAKLTEWKATFSASSSLIWPVIFTSFLVTLSVLGGTLLLIIPGIIFTVWYSFTSYTVICEGQRGLNAMRTSKNLVVGRWWPMLWRLIVVIVVFGFLNSAFSFIFAFLIRILPLPIFIQAASASVLTSLVGAVFTPLSAGAILILYVSAKQNPVAQTTLPPTLS